MRRAENEFVSSLVVEVDEAGVGTKRVSDLGRDEVQDLFEIEGRVDRGGRLGQQAEVSLGGAHMLIVGSLRTRFRPTAVIPRCRYLSSAQAGERPALTNLLRQGCKFLCST